VSIVYILLNFAALAQRLQYNSEVFKKGASDNLARINFRLLKSAEDEDCTRRSSSGPKAMSCDSEKSRNI
jgi:hypothetical protein